MLKDEFLHLIPNSEDFHNYLSYELPNIDEMYKYKHLNEIESLKESNILIFCLRTL